MGALPDGGWVLDDRDTDLYYGLDEELVANLKRHDEEYERYKKSLSENKKH